MVISVDPDCKRLLFADNSTILFARKDPDVIAEKLEKILESCSSWLVYNKLSLHLRKTESILFDSECKLRKVKRFQVSCNGKSIDSTDHVKNLGLTIDTNH